MTEFATTRLFQVVGSIKALPSVGYHSLSYIFFLTTGITRAIHKSEGAKIMQSMYERFVVDNDSMFPWIYNYSIQGNCDY